MGVCQEAGQHHGGEGPEQAGRQQLEQREQQVVAVAALAAERGGNCDLTVADQKVVSDNGVTIVGYTDFPSRMAAQSSTLYATNIRNMLTDLTPKKDGVIVTLLSPGIVQVEKIGNARRPGQIEPFESISGMIKVIDALTMDDAGVIIRYNGERQPV